MADVIHELYESRIYPAMSHPLSDPAVSAVSARLSGLDVPHPRNARVLEIGCCSGHNLLPLAQRWPESFFTGIDLSARSIEKAQDRAITSGIRNVAFFSGDLREFTPLDGPFDFIIAHGFLSWVPDDVKIFLFTFCRQHLSTSGIATISFNLECGWRSRQAVITKVRAIQEAGAGDVMSALGILKSISRVGDPEAEIIDDMIARGTSILVFDDFGPINDPWSLERFVQASSHAGLRWLGESDPSQNIPSELSDETIVELRSRTNNLIDFQQSIDEVLGRMFRSCVLCRDDAMVAGRVSSDILLDFSYRVGKEPLESQVLQIHQAVLSHAPAAVDLGNSIGVLLERDLASAKQRVFDGIARGWLRPRIEPLSYHSSPPEYPKLNGFRLLCAREALPLVDAWHYPCAFPLGHYAVLAAMDGSRSVVELASLASHRSPELAFEPWLRHLAWSGMFA